jgi:hypothetical protein
MRLFFFGWNAKVNGFSLLLIKDILVWEGGSSIMGQTTGEETLAEAWDRLEKTATVLVSDPDAETHIEAMARDMASVLHAMIGDPAIKALALPTARELAVDLAIYGLMSTLAWAEWEAVPSLGLKFVAQATLETLARMTVSRELDNLITWRLFGDQADEKSAEAELDKIEIETRMRLGNPSPSRIII